MEFEAESQCPKNPCALAAAQAALTPPTFTAQVPRPNPLALEHSKDVENELHTWLIPPCLTSQIPVLAGFA